MADKTPHQITIVSKRRDVIAFCGAIISNMLFVKSFEALDETLLQCSQIIFFDGTLLSDFKHREIIRKNERMKKKFIYIIPSLQNTNPYINEMLPVMEYVMPYPYEIDRLRFYYSKILVENDHFDLFTALTDYDFNEEDELLRKIFIGESKQIKILRSQIIKAAKNDGPVLLLGETGVGKTMAASLIHKFSSRRENPFITKAASEFQSGLIDSALFGTEEGAFTGAKNKTGYFIEANEGTFFLDEVSLASLELQGKLLLVVESGKFYPVGSHELKTADVRMIFASNENLKQKIAEGTFKQDFYFRIEHNIIHFPPLRECREDISLIARKTAEPYGKTLSADAIRKLEEYDWPGNARQLISYVKKACENLKSDKITAKDIKLEF